MDENIKRKILEYIKSNGSVSYAELEYLFEKIGYNYQGSLLTCSDMDRNVIFWGGWNENAIALIGEMISENSIKRQPCDFIIYLIDGKTMNFPLVKKYKKYKSMHWLPCVFNAVQSNSKGEV